MPTSGLGTWQTDAGPAVDAALANGVRMIDTAFIYRNETEIGEVLEKWLKGGRYGAILTDGVNKMLSDLYLDAFISIECPFTEFDNLKTRIFLLKRLIATWYYHVHEKPITKFICNKSEQLKRGRFGAD
jgi:hypothetical protein